MKEFVFGSDDQYASLRQSLEDNMCHVYRNCAYPSCCSRNAGRIGFEKEREGSLYALYIDKGVSCQGRGIPPLFYEWLNMGTLRFADFNSMVDFLRSLRCLY